jgi:hypothetical protein
VIFTLQGCDLGFKDKPGLPTSVKGQITDYYTHKGLKDVKLVFEDRERDAYPFSLSTTRTDTIRTDSGGYYHYEFITDTMRIYAIEPKSTNEYYFNELWGKYIDEGVVNTNDFTYKPYRKLHLKVINHDKFWTTIYINNRMVFPYSSIMLRGIEVDTLVELKIAPDEKNQINMYLEINNGNYSVEKDLIFYLTGNKDTTMLYEY